MMVDISKVQTETRSIDLRQNRAFSKPSKKNSENYQGGRDTRPAPQTPAIGKRPEEQIR
jgi:hypothetical protein